MMARPARVRIRRRKPWVRLRRRLLGWNVRLVTGKLPHLRSAQQSGTVLTRHASLAGAGRWQRPLRSDLLTVRGTAKPVKLDGFGPDGYGLYRYGLDGSGADANLGGLIRCQRSGPSDTEPGEYRRLACTATLRLLASRFASQVSLSYRSRGRSLVNLDAGAR